MKNDFTPASIDFNLISNSNPIVGIENAGRIFYSVDDIIVISLRGRKSASKINNSSQITCKAYEKYFSSIFTQLQYHTLKASIKVWNKTLNR